MIHHWKSSIKAASLIILTTMAFPFGASEVNANEGQDLIDQVLSEAASDTFLATSVNLSLRDYSIQADGIKPPGLKLNLVAQSLEWIRTENGLTLPRATIEIQIPSIESATIKYRSYTVPLTKTSDKISGQYTMVLLGSSTQSPNYGVVKWKDGDHFSEFKILVQYSPPNKTDTKIAIDHSCSPHNVAIKVNHTAPTWVIASCKILYNPDEKNRVPTLEMHLLWDGVNGQSHDKSLDSYLDGVPISASEPQYFKLKLRSKPGTFHLRRGPADLTVSYQIPENSSLGFLGAGVGPYTYAFHSPQADTHSYAPILTVYGGYTISQSLRFVFFDATSFHRNWYSDLGFYLTSESFRVLAGKLSLNIMLGGHALIFKSENKIEFPFGLPQGFELIARDLFAARYNLSAGAFIYPSVGNQAYYNVWLRYGTSSLFAEANYLSWEQDVSGRIYSSKAFGISVGGPLWRFF